MYRYNDNTYRPHPPATIIVDGYTRRFGDLTREEQDQAGYNEAIPVKREPFTVYSTEWVKGDDLIYREEVVSKVVDEAAREEAQAETLRQERDRLLAESDWTQLADCPLVDIHKLAWAEYRQELRNVPQQTGFPASVVWPGVPA